MITPCPRSRTAVEMPRPWKSQTDFHRRLEISQRARDSHISTSRFSLVMTNRPTIESLDARRLDNGLANQAG